MIRRNVAGQYLSLPALLLLADGSAVSSGATITVKKDGVPSAGAGSLTYDSDGIWDYTPTQSETNCAILVLILKATGAVPVVINLVTTAADTSAAAFGANTTTPPTASTISDAVWDELLSGHTVTGSTGAMLTNISNQIVDVNDGISFSFNSLTLHITTRTLPSANYFDPTTDTVTVGTNNDKTGYSLVQSFPSNFASLGINASGHINRVTLVDTTTTNTDMRGTNNALLASSYSAAPNASTIADAVWDEVQSGHETPGTFGLYLDAIVSGVSTGGISAADIADAVWEFMLPGSYTVGMAGYILGNMSSGISVDLTGVALEATSQTILTGITSLSNNDRGEFF